MKEVGKNTTGIMKTVADYAKWIGLEGNRNIEQGKPVPWGWWLANTVVFANVLDLFFSAFLTFSLTHCGTQQQIRKALGLDRCKFQATGAAPTAPDTVEYFMSLNLPLFDIFGMSESCALATACFPGQWKSNTCGSSVP